MALPGVLGLLLCARRPVAGAVVLATPLELSWMARCSSRWLVGVIPSIGRVPGIVDPEQREAHPGYRRMPLASVAELIALHKTLKK